MEKDIYNNQTYLKNNPTWHEEDAVFKAGKILSLLNRNGLTFSTVSEIGCGSGAILEELEKNMTSVESFCGYDISQDAILIAKKRETAKIRFEHKDITGPGDTSFSELQMVIDVIEHLDNYFAFLGAIVSKSQYTVFHIPLDMCVWTLFREQMLLESKDRVGHIHNFSEAFVLDVLKDYGFEVVDTMFTEPTYALKGVKQKTVGFLRKCAFSINKRFATKTFGGYSILVLAKNKG